MMKNILLIALMTVCFGTLNAQKTSSIHLIDPAALRLAIEKTSPLIIDVRTPEEYNEGHIAHAVNIDFLAQDSFVQKSPPHRPLSTGFIHLSLQANSVYAIFFLL